MIERRYAIGRSALMPGLAEWVALAKAAAKSPSIALRRPDVATPADPAVAVTAIAASPDEASVDQAEPMSARREEARLVDVAVRHWRASVFEAKHSAALADFSATAPT